MNVVGDETFYCKTNNGHILKPIIEAYSNCTKFIILNITKFAINSYVLGENHSILIKSTFPASKFDKYVCTNNINIMVATDELSMNTKNIKRKNTTHMFILKSAPDQFAISVSSNDENDNSNISRIKVTEVFDSVVLDTNFKYVHSYKINSKDLNRTIKELSKISDEIHMLGFNTHIVFRYVEEGIVKKEYKFNTARADEVDKTAHTNVIYSKIVESKLLNNIAKAITVAKQVVISVSAGLPIKIEIDSGAIIMSDIFIKTVDMMTT